MPALEFGTSMGWNSTTVAFDLVCPIIWDQCTVLEPGFTEVMRDGFFPESTQTIGLAQKRGFRSYFLNHLLYSDLLLQKMKSF